MQLFKIKYKLFFFAISQVIMAIVLLSLVVIYTEKDNYNKQAIKELTTLGDFIGVSAEFLILFEQYKEIAENLNKKMDRGKVDAIWVLVNDSVVASYVVDSALSPPSKLSYAGFYNDDGIYSKSPIKSGDKIIGDVVIQANLKELDAFLSSLTQRIVFISLLILALIVLVVFIIQTSISGPIAKLYSTASEIQKGNLKARVNVKSKDEIGQLSDVFNQMVEKILYEKDMSDMVLLNRNRFFANLGALTRDQVHELKNALELLSSFKQENIKGKEALRKVEIKSMELLNVVDDVLRITSKENDSLIFREGEIDVDELFDVVLNEYNLLSVELRNSVLIDHGMSGFLNGDFERLKNLVLFPIHSANRMQQGLVSKLKVSGSNSELIFNFSGGFNKKLSSYYYNLYIHFKDRINGHFEPGYSSLEEEVFFRTILHYNGKLNFTDGEENNFSISIRLPEKNTNDEMVDFSNLSILIIEPSTDQSAKLAESILKYGANVQVGGTGDDLHDFLKYNPTKYDLVISEVDLPLMSCFEAFKKLKEGEGIIPQYIILTTSNATNTLGQQAKELGVKKVLYKPFSTDSLITAINELAIPR